MRSGRHVVGLRPPERLARPAEPGLDLVDDERDPVLVQDRLHLGEVLPRRRDEAADALDGLGDHRRDVARRRRLDHVADVVGAGDPAARVLEAQRAPVAVRRERVAHVERGERRRGTSAVPRDPDRAEAAAVVRVAQREDLVAAPRARRHEQRRLDRLGARPDEERLRGPGDRRELDEPLGEAHHRLDQVQRRGVRDPVGLGLERVDELVDRVARDRRHDPAEQVEVLVALRVPHRRALAPDELDRPLVVEREPVRQHLAVPREQRVGRDVGVVGHGSSWASSP